MGRRCCCAGYCFCVVLPTPADLAELRKKFEEDKARIQRLKQARKFKP